MRKFKYIDSQSEEYVTHSEKETLLAAQKIGASLSGQEVVLLIGELGSGKTIFAKGIASGLGLNDVHQVCSPSFTLVNIYQAECPIYHLDLYRLEKESDISDLGWEEYLGQGVIIVEWAEKLKFKGKAVRVYIDVEDNDSRRIKIVRSVRQKD